MIALMRQQGDLNLVMNDRWTEQDALEMLNAEHNYVEWKSGKLFEHESKLKESLAKMLSAMANSHGGHIIVGMADDGQFDGVLPRKGGQSTREWFERIVPNLVEYPLRDFRVHVVLPAKTSTIPLGRIVIVIDVGDSPFAPHQSNFGDHMRTYFYREGSNSVPAPHFHLELLRQRLVVPIIEVTEIELTPTRAGVVDGRPFLATRLRYTVENFGRVAAYRWDVQGVSLEGHPKGRESSYRWGRRTFPPGFNGGVTIPSDKTLLPGGIDVVERDLGVFLNPTQPRKASV